ncbi:low affinity iron permease family protein [Micromonospora sp. NPDC007271]|uniref:low affinity iron permease family protein n=1 Tax=Micromonospora sp. NPDC007271 TaxID=3154587 RepID=UPI0033CE4B7F
MTAVDDRPDRTAKMPTDVSSRPGFFDRFATAVAGYASHAWFFAACLILVLVWAPTVIWFTIDTWQLIINTATTIITFLLVALLQNTQTRADAAVQQKLNAIADALSDLMDQHAENYPDLRRDRDELRAAVGLEDRESA